MKPTVNATRTQSVLLVILASVTNSFLQSFQTKWLFSSLQGNSGNLRNGENDFEGRVFAKEKVGEGAGREESWPQGMKSVNMGNLPPLEVGFSVSDQPWLWKWWRKDRELMTSSAT